MGKWSWCDHMWGSEGWSVDQTFLLKSSHPALDLSRIRKVNQPSVQNHRTRSTCSQIQKLNLTHHEGQFLGGAVDLMYNTHNINNQENNATCWSLCVTTAHICYHKVTPSLYMNDKLCGSFSDMQLFQSYTEETQQMTC